MMKFSSSSHIVCSQKAPVEGAIGGKEGPFVSQGKGKSSSCHDSLAKKAKFFVHSSCTFFGLCFLHSVAVAALGELPGLFSVNQ